ncbi:unnamed protein product [Closterium sp. Naga37s-1]|nr:unnamed protein product [Closterium sp. Naga37s-1]
MMWSRKRKPRLAKIEDEFPAGEGDRNFQETSPTVTSSLDESPATSSEAATVAAAAAAAAVVPAASPTSPVNPAVRPASVAEGSGEGADAGFNVVKDAERATAADDNPGLRSRGFGGGNSGGLDDSESPVRYVPLAFDIVTSGLEDEISLLERLVANHLILSQFELARAAVGDLARLSPSRAISLLRNVIVTGGEIPGAVWSASVPSAAHLTWLCVGEYRELCKVQGERGERGDWVSGEREERGEGGAWVREEDRGGSERDDWTAAAADADGQGEEEEGEDEEGEELGWRHTGDGLEGERVMVDEAEFDLYLAQLSLQVQQSASSQRVDRPVTRTGEQGGFSGAGRGGEEREGEEQRGMEREGKEREGEALRREEELRAAVTVLHDRSVWGLPSRPVVVGSRLSAGDIGEEANEAVLVGPAEATESVSSAADEERGEAAEEREQGDAERIIPDATPVGISLVVGEYPEILDELSRNVLRQRSRRRRLSTTAPGSDKRRESEGNLPSQSWPAAVAAVRWVQEAHLGAVACMVEAGDMKAAAGRLRYLNAEYGAVEEEQYRSALHQLVLALRPQVPQEAPSNTPVWTAVRKEETRIAVQELISSGSARLIRMFQQSARHSPLKALHALLLLSHSLVLPSLLLQAVWDDRIHSESQRSARHFPIAPPLEALHALLLAHGQADSDPAAERNEADGHPEATELERKSDTEGAHVDANEASELEHARVERQVVVGSVLEGALAAVHAGQFAKANHVSPSHPTTPPACSCLFIFSLLTAIPPSLQILRLCPPLLPLTTLIAWDLIGPSHPTTRLRLLWALWPHESARALLRLPHGSASAHAPLPNVPLAANFWSSSQLQLQHAGVCCAHLIYHAHLAFLIASRHATLQQQKQRKKQQQQQQQEQVSSHQHHHHPHHQQQQGLGPQPRPLSPAADPGPISPPDNRTQKGLPRMLSPKAVARMVGTANPFLARLAMELLHVQPPLHVLLSLGAHCFLPHELIKLVQAQPGAGCNVLGGTSGRDWDVELLHMLFAAHAAETAVHAMAGGGRGGEIRGGEGKGGEGKGGEGREGVQVQCGAAEAIRAVESYEHHAARVTTAARKIWMGYTVRSLFLLTASNSAPADEDCLAAVAMARLQQLAKHDVCHAHVDAHDAAAGADVEKDAAAAADTGDHRLNTGGTSASVALSTPSAVASSPPAVAVMEALLAAVARHLPPQGTETHGMARPFLLDASPLSGVDRRAARALLTRNDVGEVGSGGGDDGGAAANGAAAASPAAPAAAADGNGGVSATAAAASAGLKRTESEEKQLGQKGEGRPEGLRTQEAISFLSRRKRRLLSGDGAGEGEEGMEEERLEQLGGGIDGKGEEEEGMRGRKADGGLPGEESLAECGSDTDPSDSDTEVEGLDAEFAAELDAELDAQASDVAAAAVAVLASDWKQRAQVVRDWLDDWQWRLAVLKADWLGVHTGRGKREEGRVSEKEEVLERHYEEEEEVEKEDNASGSEQEGGMEGRVRNKGEVQGQAGKGKERRLRSDWWAWEWHEVVAWMRVEPSALISCCLSVGDFSLCASRTRRFPLAVHSLSLCCPPCLNIGLVPLFLLSLYPPRPSQLLNSGRLLSLQRAHASLPTARALTGTSAALCTARLVGDFSLCQSLTRRFPLAVHTEARVQLSAWLARHDQSRVVRWDSGGGRLHSSSSSAGGGGADIAAGSGGSEKGGGSRGGLERVGSVEARERRVRENEQVDSLFSLFFAPSQAMWEMFPALDMVAVLLDAAATQARTAPDALVLLDQARTVLTAWHADQQGLKEEDKSRGGKNQPGKQHQQQQQQQQEREEDSSNSLSSVQWVTAERLLQRLEAIQNQDPTTPLPSLLAAVQPHLSPSPGLSGSAGVRRGPKARAVMALQQVVADCEAGTAQFVSGKLHNLIRALEDPEPAADPLIPAPATAAAQSASATCPPPGSGLGFGIGLDVILPDQPATDATADAATAAADAIAGPSLSSSSSFSLWRMLHGGGGGAGGGGPASVPAVSARTDSQGSVAAAAAVAGLASATGSGGVRVAAGSPVHTPPLSPRWTRSSSGLGLSAAATAAAAAAAGASVAAAREGALEGAAAAAAAAAVGDLSEGGSTRSTSLPLPSTSATTTTASAAAAPSPLSLPTRTSTGAVSMPPPSTTTTITTTTITSTPSAAAAARASAPPGAASDALSGASSGASSGARASAPLPPVPRSSMPSLWPFSFNSANSKQADSANTKQPDADGQNVVGLQSLLGSATGGGAAGAAEGTAAGGAGRGGERGAGGGGGERGGGGGGLAGAVSAAAAGLRGPGKQPWDHPKGYLPVFLNYVVQIGDIVDDSDPSHPFNYFSLLNVDPVELLRELVFVRGDIAAASHVAGIMGRESLPADIIPAALPSLLPPVPSLKLCSVARRFRSRLLGRSRGGLGQGRPGKGKVAGGVGGVEGAEKLLAPSPYEPPRFALSMDVVQLLARESMVHAVLACVLGAEQQIVQMHRRKERERDLKTIGAFSGGGGAATSGGAGGVGRAGGVLGGDRSRGKGGGVGGVASAVEAEEEAAKKLMEYARVHSAGTPIIHRWVTLQSAIHSIAIAAAKAPSRAPNQQAPPAAGAAAGVGASVGGGGRGGPLGAAGGAGMVGVARVRELEGGMQRTAVSTGQEEALREQALSWGGSSSLGGVLPVHSPGSSSRRSGRAVTGSALLLAGQEGTARRVRGARLGGAGGVAESSLGLVGKGQVGEGGGRGTKRPLAAEIDVVDVGSGEEGVSLTMGGETTRANAGVSESESDVGDTLSDAARRREGAGPAHGYPTTMPEQGGWAGEEGRARGVREEQGTGEAGPTGAAAATGAAGVAGAEGVVGATARTAGVAGAAVASGRLEALLTEWEDLRPVRIHLESLIADSRLAEALELADTWLPEGAPDHLLCLLVEQAERSEGAAAAHTHTAGVAGVAGGAMMRFQKVHATQASRLQHSPRIGGVGFSSPGGGAAAAAAAGGGGGIEGGIRGGSAGRGVRKPVTVGDSWRFVIRVADKELAAALALRYHHSWQLSHIHTVFNTCLSHLPSPSPLRAQILTCKSSVDQYTRIRSVLNDRALATWQQVRSLCFRDPESVCRQLAAKGAVKEAVSLAEAHAAAAAPAETPAGAAAAAAAAGAGVGREAAASVTWGTGAAEADRRAAMGAAAGVAGATGAEGTAPGTAGAGSEGRVGGALLAELRGRYLSELMGGDPLQGDSGPAVGMRYLERLMLEGAKGCNSRQDGQGDRDGVNGDSAAAAAPAVAGGGLGSGSGGAGEEARRGVEGREGVMGVVLSAMRWAPSLHAKKLIVNFVLKRAAEADLPPADVADARQLQLGLQLLGTFPAEWQQRLGGQHVAVLLQPELIVESLIMEKHTSLLPQHSLRSSSSIPRPPSVPPAPITSSFLRIQQQASRVFPWGASASSSSSSAAAASNTPPFASPVPSPRGASGFGGLIGRPVGYLPGGRTGLDEVCEGGSGGGEGEEGEEEAMGRLGARDIQQGAILIGEETRDGETRALHVFPDTPDISLFQSLASLCSRRFSVLKGLLAVVVEQAGVALAKESVPRGTSLLSLTQTAFYSKAYLKAQLVNFGPATRSTGSAREPPAQVRSRGSAQVRGRDPAQVRAQLKTLKQLLGRAEAWIARVKLLRRFLADNVGVGIDELGGGDPDFQPGSPGLFASLYIHSVMGGGEERGVAVGRGGGGGGGGDMGWGGVTGRSAEMQQQQQPHQQWRQQQQQQQPRPTQQQQQQPRSMQQQQHRHGSAQPRLHPEAEAEAREASLSATLALRDGLVKEECYELAAALCDTCHHVNPCPVYKAWAMSLIRVKNYTQARHILERLFLFLNPTSSSTPTTAPAAAAAAAAAAASTSGRRVSSSSTSSSSAAAAASSQGAVLGAGKTGGVGVGEGVVGGGGGGERMAVVAREVVRFIETCIPADVPGTQLLLSQTEKAVADSFQDSLTAESYLGALTSTSSLFSSPTLRPSSSSTSSSSRPSSLAPLPAPAFGATNNTPSGPAPAAATSAGVSPILGSMPPPATLSYDDGRKGGGQERLTYARQSAFEAQGPAWSGQGEGEFRRQEEGQGEGNEERMEGQGEGVAVVEDEERETFSYLDDERFNECTQLLKKHAPRDLLPFMFRHGRYRSACWLLFFPPPPPPPRPSSSSSPSLSSTPEHGSSSTTTTTATTTLSNPLAPQPPAFSLSPARPTLSSLLDWDPLKSEYATVEELCALCVSYGALEELERVVAEALGAGGANGGAAGGDLSVATAAALPASAAWASGNVKCLAALSRICTFFESQKNFHFLFRFLLLARDYVAAGLCSIQLFLYSPDLRTAATHLQQAQLLFEKGTEARQNAAADLAASIGPLAAAGKRLAISAASSSSAAAAAAGAAAAGAAAAGAAAAGAGAAGAGGTGAGASAGGGAGISGAGTSSSGGSSNSSSTTTSVALIAKQRSATAKISDEDLLRLQRLAELQVEVVRVVGACSGRDSSGVPLVGAARKAPWSVALFGAVWRRRVEVTEFLVEREFDLALEVINFLHLPAVQICRRVEVTEFLVQREFDLVLNSRRRVEVTEFLVEREFDLALEVINFLHLPAVQIYASVAASLAEKQQHRVLFEGLMDRIKYMLPPADMDEVIGAAVMVYTHTAVKLSNLSLTFTGRQDMSRSVKLPKEQIDRLIHMLSDEHKKVLFNVVCRRLRLAFQIATGHFQLRLAFQIATGHFQPQGGQGGVAATVCTSGSSSSTGGGGSSSGGGGFGPVYPLQSRINDVIFIMHEARNAPKVREHCREWLAARGVVIDNVEPHTQPHLLPHTHAWPLGHGAQPSHSLR